MSCVIGTVFKNFAIISGDTRLSKDSGETISDTFSKVFKKNQNVLVGFTGSGNAVDVLNKKGIFDKDDCPSAEDYLEFLWLLYLVEARLEAGARNLEDQKYQKA